MVFVRTALFPDGTKTHYEALARELDGVEIPTARRVFIAGETDDGWQVIQVWDTKEDLDRFNARVFLPALQRVGGRGFPTAPIVRDFYATACDVRELKP